MNTLLPLRVAIGIVTLFFSSERLRGETIQVWGGDSTSGGYGDLATNLLMAENLQSLLPQASITLIVPKEGDGPKMFADLGVVPGVSLPSGVKVAIESDTPDRSDFLLSFSEQEPPPKALREAAKNQFSFLEYGNMGKSTLGLTAWSSRSAPFEERADKPGEKPFFGGGAGPGANSLGFYTLPEAPSVDSKDLSQLKNYSKTLPPDIRPDVKLGFAYSNKPEVNHRYLEGMARVAEKQPFGKRVVVVTNHPPPKGFVGPSNLEVVVAPRMPFKMTQALLARADLPVLVTGDVSITLALQHGKIPLYETLDHKIDFLGQLRQSLTDVNPRLADPELAALLSRALPNLVDVNRLDAKTVESIASNPVFQSEFVAATKKLAQTKSMPVFVARMISDWKKSGFATIQKSEQDKIVFQTLGTSPLEPQVSPIWEKTPEEIVSDLKKTKTKAELEALLNQIARWRTKGDIGTIVEDYLTSHPYGSPSLPKKVRLCQTLFGQLRPSVVVNDIR